MPTAAQQRRAAAAAAGGGNTDPKAVEKQLGIQVRAVQRLAKDHTFYHKEVTENESKLEEMKSRKADQYDIKKFEEVLGESYMMVPDSKRRLEKDIQDLKIFLENSASSILDPENEWLVKANGLLVEHGQKEDNSKTSETEEGDEIKTNLDDLEEGEAF
jgi:tubulin-specific chaperone A